MRITARIQPVSSQTPDPIAQAFSCSRLPGIVS
jgi:hypothetical protein